jgi:hypothetical protein
MQFNLHFTLHMFCIYIYIYIYTIHTRPLSAQAQYRSCFIIYALRYNSSPDTWRSYAWPPSSVSLTYFVFSLKVKVQITLRLIVVGQSVLVSGTHLGPATNVSPVLFDHFRHLRVCWLGRPLWREDGSVICSALTQVQFQVYIATDCL